MDLRPHFPADEFATLMTTAHMNLPACLGFHLQFVPGLGGIGATYGPERARWSRYLPSRMLPREDVAA